MDNENVEELEIEDNEQPEVEEASTDKSAEYLDRLQRLMAEFDNYRKRTEKEKVEAYDRAISSTVTELLGTIDNFERALLQESEDKAFYEGVTMIYKQLIGSLEKIGVTPIDAAGKEFNPTYHNAIMHVEDDSVGTNTVLEELQKGYIFKEKVLRHSLVKVAN